MRGQRVILPLLGMCFGVQLACATTEDIADKLEPILLERFNNVDETLYLYDLDDTIGLDLPTGYIQFRNGHLLEQPQFKALTIKLHPDKNIIKLSISFGEVYLQVKGLFVNKTEDVKIPKFPTVIFNITKLYGEGYISVSPTGNYLVPTTYNLDYHYSGHEIKEIYEEDVYPVTLDTPLESVSDFNYSTRINRRSIEDSLKSVLYEYSMLQRLQLHVDKILSTVLETVPLDTIYQTPETLSKYRLDAQNTTNAANKIMDDILSNIEDKAIFGTVETYKGFVLPKLVNKLLKPGGIQIADGNAQYGKFKRDGDFNLYEENGLSNLVGYITIDKIKVVNNYTTKYDTKAVTGEMQTIAKDVKFMLHISIDKASCKVTTKINIHDFGIVKTHVTPENTYNLLRFSQEELGYSLVGNFRFNLLETGLETLTNGFTLERNSIGCKPAL